MLLLVPLTARAGLWRSVLKTTPAFNFKARLWLEQATADLSCSDLVPAGISSSDVLLQHPGPVGASSKGKMGLGEKAGGTSRTL